MRGRRRRARRPRRCSCSATASWPSSACRAWPRTTRSAPCAPRSEMQRAFRELADEQAAAVGQTRPARRGQHRRGRRERREHDVIGDPVNVAARLQQEARDGDVVIGEATRRLVGELVTLAPLGSFALKGRSESGGGVPRGVARAAGGRGGDRVRRARRRAARASRRSTTAPSRRRAARLAVLLGSPGLGKSRLIDEFARRLGDAATVLMAHCDAAGGATFAPLAEALRALLRIDDAASGDALRAAIESALPATIPSARRIASGVAALLAGSPASPEEIFFVVRRLLAALAAARPVVLVIDDLQWAEPLLLDLIEHLVQWGSGVPLLVLAAARPELRDTRSSLATPGGLVADVVTLAGLDAGAADATRRERDRRGSAAGRDRRTRARHQRGQSALRRRAGAHARARRRAQTRGRSLDDGRRARRRRDAAHHPRAARRAHRAPAPRGANACSSGPR